MPTFIVRAHSAPTDPAAFLGRAGADAHVEYLAQIVTEGLFVSKGHRSDMVLVLVLERSTDFSRAITLRGDCLGSLDGLTENDLLETLADALHAGRDLAKEASISLENGITVAAISFERVVKQQTGAREIFLLDKKGEDVRDAMFGEDPVFLLTDHVPMPRNLHKSLIRQGAKPISIGPLMLRASQAIVIVQNEIDRRIAG
ncbi:MAG TPA: hypothetical protein VJ998_04005 [Pseudomonadales bacterium]|nr:hypothetical protein [Pseudomonadales bacterium]